MECTPLSTQIDHNELESITRRIAAGRYFRQLDEQVLEQMLRRGELVRCNPEEVIFQEGDEQAARLGVLLEGSLAVTSQESFLMRLDQTGDVIGEMSVLRPGPHSASVVAEVESWLVMFPNELFTAPEHSAEVSAIYLVFAHILAEKLRITTAQTRLQRGNRASDEVQPPKIGVVDSNPESLEQLLALVQDVWPRGQVSEISKEKLLEGDLTQRFDLILVDPLDGESDTEVVPAIEGCVLASEMILAVSRYCTEEGNREQLAKLGVTSFLSKPFSEFDCRHLLSQLRVSYYRQRELEQVEHAADTDRLTGLANRRKLDEFIEALVTLYPERQEPFSLIIADVDNFKHYNDTHGHQMGDVVLATVSSVFKTRVRRGDLAARFGGEEFVMMLPKCNKANALRIGEKLRKAIADEDIPYQEQQPLGNLTATFGVATFPEDAESIEHLLKQADDCLYQGKESGRNVVIGANPI